MIIHVSDQMCRTQSFYLQLEGFLQSDQVRLNQIRILPESNKIDWITFESDQMR